jgi:hypothetical protein
MGILGMLWGRRGAGYSPLVDRYREYRRIAWKLNNEILPEYLSRPTLDAAGKRLGMLRRNAVVMDHEDELGLWMDYAIHDVWERGSNAVGRYRRDVPPEPRSDEYAVVRAMSESFYTLVRVMEALPRVGVRVLDLWADQEYLLIDMGFSRSARRGLVLATRILPFGEFVTTSGAALPVGGPTLQQIQDSVLPKYKIAQEGKCALADGRRKTAELTAAIIRLCLESGASDRIQYTPFATEPPASPRG